MLFLQFKNICEYTNRQLLQSFTDITHKNSTSSLYVAGHLTFFANNVGKLLQIIIKNILPDTVYFLWKKKTKNMLKRLLILKGKIFLSLPARGVATSITEPLLAGVAIHHTGRIMNAAVTMGRNTIIIIFYM